MKYMKLFLSILITTVIIGITNNVSYSWTGESSFDDITRETIMTIANEMKNFTWTPLNNFNNWAYISRIDHQLHRKQYSGGTIYTGVAYTQGNDQENWSEFLNLVTNTKGGTLSRSESYGNDCSGFVSIAWRLPKRYDTTIFEYDATHDGGYCYSLGAKGSGPNVTLYKGDAFVRSGSHIILFDHSNENGTIQSLEQTPWRPANITWYWSTISGKNSLTSYRPIRRYKINDNGSSTACSCTGDNPVLNCTVTAGQTLNCTGHNSITLKDGFHAEQGSAVTLKP